MGLHQPKRIFLLINLGHGPKSNITYSLFFVSFIFENERFVLQLQIGPSLRPTFGVQSTRQQAAKAHFRGLHQSRLCRPQRESTLLAVSLVKKAHPVCAGSRTVNLQATNLFIVISATKGWGRLLPP